MQNHNEEKREQERGWERGGEEEVDTILVLIRARSSSHTNCTYRTKISDV